MVSDNIREGHEAPEVCLPDKDGVTRCLSELKGKWVVLYFYPKDSTSGCTQEANDFTRMVPDLRNKGAEVIGISPDSCESHKRFSDDQAINFTLLSDPDHVSLVPFGVWAKKSMYGREYMGVERSTFLIDPQGKVHKAWRKVKVEGHAREVMDTLEKALGH